ncbi:Uncharacterized protein HZ326_18636 [Fusarium oxysporum f. sp. albedinis]|nr:Uncharacterized protein HZ326_18636 [Fusarium oxysporum f. sp. albedinis]
MTKWPNRRHSSEDFGEGHPEHPRRPGVTGLSSPAAQNCPPPRTPLGVSPATLTSSRRRRRRERRERTLCIW